MISRWGSQLALHYASASDVELLEIVDLLIGSYYKLHTKDMLVHHTVHIVAGYMIWSAGIHALAKPLMMQELSSIMLNVFVYARNRDAALATPSFVGFALLFAVFRMGGGTLAAYRFFRAGTHPVLSYFVCAGASMQWYWGWNIALKVRRKLSAGAKATKS